MNNANEQALEDFQDGKSVGQYRTSEDGDTYESAAFNETVHFDQIDGIDVVGELSEEYLVAVETDDVREVDAELEDREYLDQTFEYNVDVEVYDRDGEVVDEGEAVILSGSAYETGPQVWANHAADSALDDASVERVEGNGTSSDGEIVGLLDEEEESGLDAIDQV